MSSDTTAVPPGYYRCPLCGKPEHSSKACEYAPMPKAVALKCRLCGRVGSGVEMAVKTGDFVGQYHLIPRCVDTEACWRRTREKF